MKKRNLLIIVLGVITTLKLSAYDFVFVNGGYIGDFRLEIYEWRSAEWKEVLLCGRFL